MAKRKKSIAPKKGDNKAASIIVFLFLAAIVAFYFISKHKETPVSEHKIKSKPRVSAEGSDAYIPNEHVKPVTVETTQEEYPVVKPARREYVPEPVPVLPPTEEEPVEHGARSGGKIAIILDDWGQSVANCRYLKEIPEPLAIAILPGLRHTKDVANCAKLNHKLTMLHLPLEALHNNDLYPPNYIVKTTMNPDLASKVVEADIAQLPSIEGVNNHMGSKATENRPLMRLIFKKLKRKGLFFVDSMTARGTVCAALADEMGITFGKRDVFLDNINTKEAITKQIMELAQKAHHRGYAVAIGHDRHLTMQVIKDMIPVLERQGLKIVSIKELLKNR